MGCCYYGLNFVLNGVERQHEPHWWVNIGSILLKWMSFDVHDDKADDDEAECSKTCQGLCMSKKK